MSGPAPKSNGQRRRRNAPRANTVKLPAAGRTGSVPDWPFQTIVPRGWPEIWSRPQAVMWESMGVIDLVARYVDLREKVTSPEFPESRNASFWSALTALEDRLGLSPMAMMRLQWEITGTTDADYTEQGPQGEEPAPEDDVVDLRARAGFGDR